ncbi:CU044_5270 family protein [Streptosporangium sp. NPDC006013]|uniref:CU044_5270 family protein n=1 Tax=Streptosporangium sp. NPDC006013 TaxID=3155596 RepID=UPI0033B66843
MKKTDVMKSLSDTRPASLKPVDDPERLDRIIAAATTRPSTVSVVPRRGRIKPGWGLGTAGVVAAGLAVAVTLVPGGAGDRSAEPAARGLLLAAAEQTVKVPTVAGRYWHTRGVNSGGLFSGRSSRGVCRDETWVAKSPKDPSWWIVHSWTRLDAVKGAEPPKEGEFSSDQAHFTCARGNRALSDETGKTPYASRLNDFAEPGSSWPNVNGKAVSVADIERLPTEPEALKEVLIQWQGPGMSDKRRDEILFEQAAELLLELPAPSEVRAALFRLMADLPEVRSLGGVRDPLGRDAVGVALRSCEPSYGTETQVLFDKDTGRLLSVGRSAGEQGCADLRPAGWSAVLESGWTDESPKAPAGHA